MLNVCFCESGAGTLRHLLKIEGRKEKVVCLQDLLGIGPIQDVCGVERRLCLEEVFGFDDPHEFAHSWTQIESFWSNMKSIEGPLRVWMTRRSTLELSGFMELVSILPPETDLELIDFTDVELPMGRSAKKTTAVFGTGIMNDDQLSHGFSMVQHLPLSAFESERSIWKRLKDDNAPLRIFAGRQLISAEAEHFDPALLFLISVDWQKASHVVGNFLSTLNEAVSEIGDGWLFYRLRKLAEQGAVEIKHDGDMVRGMVRLGRTR